MENQSEKIDSSKMIQEAENHYQKAKFLEKGLKIDVQELNDCSDPHITGAAITFIAFKNQTSFAIATVLKGL